MPKEPSSSTSRLRAATLQVAPFGVAGIAAPLVSLGGDGQEHLPTLLLGFLLTFASLGALTLAVARPAGRLATNVSVYAWLASLTFLVYSTGGANSGATLVLFLPALWVSLYGVRVDALITLALMLSGVIAVSLLDGASEFTTTDVRRLIAFITIPSLAVWTISTLVQRQSAASTKLVAPSGR